MVRCGLAVRPDAEVDEALLALLERRTGRRFHYHGSGGFGVELLATVYRDTADNLLIEAKAIDAPVKAVVIRTGSAEDAIEIRQAVGDHLGGWSEQMLRRQLEEDGLDSDPGVLVAIVLAGGGGPLEDATVDLINAAAGAEDATIANWGAYAIRVAHDLDDPPIVLGAGEAACPEVLLPVPPVDGDEEWVTARPGVPDRAIPRETTWLRVPEADSKVFHQASWRADWLIAVAGDTRADWYEEIYTTEDERTAIHLVRHPALDVDHIVVHGEDVESAVAALRAVGEVEKLDGPPPSLADTAP